MTKIISWNINGLSHMIKNGFFDFIYNEQPDIICLQETKTNEENVVNLLKPLDGVYHLECFSSVHENHFPYSGVATLSRLKPSKLTKTFGSDQFDKEGRILISEYPAFVLYNCYFPTGASGQKYQDMKRAFYQECAQSIKNTRASGKEVILCGDFNTARDERDIADVLRKNVGPGFLPEDRKDIERFFSEGLIDAFRIKTNDGGHYTWWSSAKSKQAALGWRIDYFLISPNLKSRFQACCHKPELVKTDHCPVILELRDDNSTFVTNQMDAKSTSQ
ncbi:MAG TPA: exodeoxyribonuclease III [Methanoregula sp.]|nr:exodeoxyribonuclease III [Methanoregula sp.]